MIDEPATEKVAQKIAAPLGVELEKQQRERAGQAIHYAYGALWGGISSLLTARASGLASATGLVFGTGLWLLGDEIIVPALGLSPPPRSLPLETHVGGLVAHLVYGLATDRGLRLLHEVFD